MVEGTNVWRILALGGCVFVVWRLWRLEVTNVAGILALGGSMCGIVRVSEAPGGPLEARSDECLEDLGPGGQVLTNVLRIDAPGSHAV